MARRLPEDYPSRTVPDSIQKLKLVYGVRPFGALHTSKGIGLPIEIETRQVSKLSQAENHRNRRKQTNHNYNFLDLFGWSRYWTQSSAEHGIIKKHKNRTDHKSAKPLDFASGALLSRSEPEQERNTFPLNLELGQNHTSTALR